MLPLALLLLSLPAPVLLDPQTALTEAAAAAQTAPLRAAETQLLAGDPAGALRTLRAFTPRTDGEGDRRARLLLDAGLRVADPAAVEEAKARLELQPGWRAHLRRIAKEEEHVLFRSRLTRFGEILFALALAATAVSASRALLRLHPETLGFAVAVALALALTSREAPGVRNAIGLIALSTLAIVHTTVSARSRAMPLPRARFFLLTGLLIGVLGAWTTVLSQVPIIPFAL